MYAGAGPRRLVDPQTECANAVPGVLQRIIIFLLK